VRIQTLLLATVIGGAGAVLPAAPAAACITVYLPVIGSVCAPCGAVDRTYATADSSSGGALPDEVSCPL
jgi:hypothetical protein